MDEEEQSDASVEDDEFDEFLGEEFCFSNLTKNDLNFEKK